MSHDQDSFTLITTNTIYDLVQEMWRNLEEHANGIEEHKVALRNDFTALKDGLRNVMRTLDQIQMEVACPMRYPV